MQHHIPLCLLLAMPGCGGLADLPARASIPASAQADSAHATALLTITALDIGQGDATFVQLPGGHTLLIDGGPPGAGHNVILPFLAAHDIRRIDATLASHYDIDHIGGLPEVFDGPDGQPNTADDMMPTTCWDRGGVIPTDNGVVRYYGERRAACHQTIHAGMTLTLDAGVSLQVLAVNGVFADGETVSIDPDDENAHSIALLLSYGRFHYLTMGDLPGGGGDPPYTTVDLETPLATLLSPISVLHASHHGSQTATNAALLAATKPEAVVISIGNANPYGHPHRAVLQRLATAGMPLYLTEHGDNALPETAKVMRGPIVITTTGEEFEVN